MCAAWSAFATSAHDRGEVLAVHQLPHDELVAALVLAEVEHRDDVRMAQGRGGPRLVAEPGDEVGILPELGPQDLHRHVPLQLGVACAVDRGHATLAQELHEAVATAEDAADLGHVLRSPSGAGLGWPSDVERVEEGAELPAELGARQRQLH
jgi:hypothetical protein